MSDSMRISPGPSSSSADASISQTAALTYWTSITPDVNGMLGGYPQISRIDLQGSSNFITKLQRKRRLQQQQLQPPLNPREQPTPPPFSRAVDCGAGIGRISLGLLCKIATIVDIVEPVTKFTREISAGNRFAEARAQGKIGDIYNVGLEAWTPEHTYDLIWNQWCLGQLTDAQLVAYFRRCKEKLHVGGWIIVKENLSTDPRGEDVFDETDSSVTRSDVNWRRCFNEAGLNIVATEVQRGFPSGLFPVRTYALQPMETF